MAILQSGYIKKSSDTVNDAAYGPGTYLTNYGPKKSMSDVAENNYDGIASQMEKAGRVDAIIAVDIPTKDYDQVHSDRDICLVKGDVTLDGNNPRLYLRDKDGNAHEYEWE